MIDPGGKMRSFIEKLRRSGERKKIFFSTFTTLK